MRSTCSIMTPLGEMIALVEQDGLAGLWFVGQKHAPEGMEGWERNGEHPVLLTLADRLRAYFAGEPVIFDLPLSPQGTPFQLAVWKLLQAIPRGEVTTYGALARELAAMRGVLSSARAVGSAVGRNPLCIIIPCHRVVGSDGSLTGYAGGMDRKKALLALEQTAGVTPCPLPEQ